ncbi:MAG: hypothetical protein HYV97_18440 [Bdellovibrio sp.]|nr:hypothetical protein [Bdellovibrio sp.]
MALSEMVKENWEEIKTELRRKWSKLTDKELEKTEGDEGMICGLIHKKYGGKPETYSAKVSEIFQRFELREEEPVEMGEEEEEVEEQESGLRTSPKKKGETSQESSEETAMH